MRSLNLSDHQCGCDSGGEHFKCYCSELKENSQTKFRKRLSSCKNFIKNRSSKKSYGNVINVEDEGHLVRSQSVSLAASYTLKKDLKDLLHITSTSSKKVEEQCSDIDDAQISPVGSTKSESSLHSSSNESIDSKQSSTGSWKSKSGSKKSKSSTLPSTATNSDVPERWISRRDSNESIDARFEIILPS